MVLKTLWFASSNANKISEIKAILEPLGYQVKTLLDLTPPLEIIETGTSFAQNAILKATTLAKRVNDIVIADDSGLEILALDNFPGIYSSRWKGEMTFQQAMVNILEQLNGVSNRSAWFICTLAYVDLKNNVVKTFVGKLDGEITTTIKGTNGFGYDQIFYVLSQNATLAELSLASKNQISHRFQALSQLLNFLKTNNDNDL